MVKDPHNTEAGGDNTSEINKDSVEITVNTYISDAHKCQKSDESLRYFSPY